MKQILAKRVEETFRNEQSVDLAVARQELASLQKLLDNEFKEKVFKSSFLFLFRYLFFFVNSIQYQKGSLNLPGRPTIILN
jgi:hypothetical protein